MLLTKHDFVKRRIDTYGHSRTDFVLRYQRSFIRSVLETFGEQLQSIDLEIIMRIQ